MEDESSYEYTDDEASVQSEDEDLQDEVEFHLEIKKNAYDRYMDMLLKKAFEKVGDQEDDDDQCQSEDDNDDDEA